MSAERICDDALEHLRVLSYADKLNIALSLLDEVGFTLESLEIHNRAREEYRFDEDSDGYLEMSSEYLQEY